MADVTFWLDPACYWTWRTGRWLAEVAHQRDLSIDWRSFSLVVLYGDDMNPDWRDMLETSHRSLRVLEALKADGRADDAARFYFELGAALHEQGQSLTTEEVKTATEEAAVSDAFVAMDDPVWDKPIREAFDAAMVAAGPDIGSPVLKIAGHDRGLHGPVFADTPPASAAGELWDAVVTLSGQPRFFELKRGRE
jgi:hypothetical protein